MFQSHGTSPQSSSGKQNRPPCHAPASCDTCVQLLAVGHGQGHLPWDRPRALSAPATGSRPRSWWPYLNCLEFSLGQLRLRVVRGKHALKPKLGTGSRLNKSLISVWSVLTSHTAPPDINPIQAGGCKGGNAHWPTWSGTDKGRDNMFNDETWKRECLLPSPSAWFTVVSLLHQKTLCSSAASYCKADHDGGFIFFSEAAGHRCKTELQRSQGWVRILFMLFLQKYFTQLLLEKERGT